MKKEIVGFVGESSGDWYFENKTDFYSSNIPCALDELLGIQTEDGDKYKITIEKLN